MISLFVVFAIASSIALGYRTKINTGLFAMVFAYIIGCFCLGLKSKEVVAMWPIQIFFVIFGVSLFYNFALLNGTLEKLASILLYQCRKVPRILPYALFLAAALIAGLGAGFFTVMAFMAPITLMLCNKTGLNKLVAGVAINYGALGGANFMTSQSGIVFRGLIESVGYTEDAFLFATLIFVTSMLLPFFVITFLMFATHSHKVLGAHIEVSKPEAFDAKQRMTLGLIGIMMGLALFPPVLHTIIPANQTIQFINSRMDIGLISVTMAVLALLMKLADEKQAVSKVPWGTLIMICGVGMLISVAIKAWTIDILAGWVGTNIPAYLVPFTLAVIGGMMSFFSSTLGVVCPALFPIVPAIADTTALPGIVLFTSIVIGAQATAISPFSSGGSLYLGSCRDEEERNHLFTDLMFKAVPICLTASVLASILIFLLF